MEEKSGLTENIVHKYNNDDQLGLALGKIVSGVYVITVQNENEFDGLLCSFVQQVAFKPAKIMFSLAKSRPFLRTVKAVQKLTLNILPAQNNQFLKAFGKPGLSSEERFDMIKFQKQTVFGPIFPEALAYINLTLDGSYEVGDHEVISANCNNGVLLNSELEPMIHIRPDGFKY